MDIIEKNTATVNRHPWEISRCNNLLSIIKEQSFRGPYADIGAGDLYLAARLKTELNPDIDAVDEAYKTFNPLNPFKIRLYDDISQLQESSYGSVLLFDVLEHIEKDSDFLKHASSLLKKDGRLLVTVPAHQFLFSEHDAFLKHKRRYSMRSLKTALRNAGFEAGEIFYFYSTLYLGRMIELFSGLLGFRPYSKNAVNSWKYSEGALITKFIVSVLDMDFRVCRLLAKNKLFAPGLSLCATCKKTSS